MEEIFAPSEDFTMVLTAPTTETYEALEPDDVTEFDTIIPFTTINYFASLLKDIISKMFPFTANPMYVYTGEPVSTVSSQPPRTKPGGLEPIVEEMLSTSVGTLDSTITSTLDSTISSLDSTTPSTSDPTVPHSDEALRCDILPPGYPGCSEFLKTSDLREMLPESLDSVEADTPGYRSVLGTVTPVYSLDI